MKTLAEKLADLKAKLLVAKTDDERKVILDEIDSIIADATKVQDKLKTSNEEAKKSREKAEALQKIIDGNNDDESEEESEEDTEDKTKVKDDDKMPAWAKSLAQSVKSLSDTVTQISTKDQAVKKSELIKASLKDAGLSESFAGSIIVEGEDQEQIDTAVTAFKQTLIDEKLLSSEGVKIGERKNIQNESILNYAKEKNGGKSSIVGKKLLPDTE